MGGFPQRPGRAPATEWLRIKSNNTQLFTAQQTTGNELLPDNRR